MKNKFILFKFGFVILSVVLFGFVSCSDDDENNPAIVCFEPDPVSITITGTVKSAETSELLSNVKVSFADFDFIHTFSDEKGEFMLKGTFLIGGSRLSMNININESDAKPGFDSKKISVDFVNVEYDEEFGTFKGNAEKNIGTIELTTEVGSE